MNRTGNSLHGRLGRQRRRMGDRTVGRAGRIGPRSLAVSGYAGHRSLRFFLGAFRLDAQIESGIAAVAQIGEKMFQHVSVRLSPLQIHQPLFPPVDDLALGVVYPYGRTIENIQHLAAVGNVGSGDPFPKHPPCDALGMVLDQRSRNVSLADKVGFELLRPALRQPLVGFRRPVGGGIRADNDLSDAVLFQRPVDRIQETIQPRAVIPERRIDVMKAPTVENPHRVHRFLSLHVARGKHEREP